MIVIRNISLIVEFEQVKSENKYQELLTATMSHEMLTPLNSIINLSIYLEDRIRESFDSKKEHSKNIDSKRPTNLNKSISESV